MADDDYLSSPYLRLDLVLIAVGSAAIVVTIYHCISVCWCKRQRQQRSGSEIVLETATSGRSTSTSTAQLIPTHKYQKDKGLVGGDGTCCAVCLCEFEEGEELRTLPGCMHSFHMPCIDMWLYSHPNCPICRRDFSFGQLEAHLGVLQDTVVQSRTE